MSGISVSTPMYAWYDANDFISWILTAAGATKVPYVMSISYGEYENYLTSSNMLTWNTEAIKLGLQGITLVVSSGDTGTTGSYGQTTSYGSAACG
jgi:subtilase family serine protease